MTRDFVVFVQGATVSLAFVEKAIGGFRYGPGEPEFSAQSDDAAEHQRNDRERRASDATRPGQVFFFCLYWSTSAFALSALHGLTPRDVRIGPDADSIRTQKTPASRASIVSEVDVLLISLYLGNASKLSFSGVKFS